MPARERRGAERCRPLECAVQAASMPRAAAARRALRGRRAGARRLGRHAAAALARGQRRPGCGRGHARADPRRRRPAARQRPSNGSPGPSTGSPRSASRTATSTSSTRRANGSAEYAFEYSELLITRRQPVPAASRRCSTSRSPAKPARASTPTLDWFEDWDFWLALSRRTAFLHVREVAGGLPAPPVAIGHLRASTSPARTRASGPRATP